MTQDQRTLDQKKPGSPEYQNALNSYWDKYNGLTDTQRGQLEESSRRQGLSSPASRYPELSRRNDGNDASSLDKSLQTKGLAPSGGAKALLQEDWTLNHADRNGPEYAAALAGANAKYDALTPRERQEWASASNALGFASPIQGNKPFAPVTVTQGNEGNCALLANINGLGSTARGADLLRGMVTQVPGTTKGRGGAGAQWDVKFPGDDKKTFRVSREDLSPHIKNDHFGTGDIVGAAINKRQISEGGKSVYDGDGNWMQKRELLTGHKSVKFDAGSEKDKTDHSANGDKAAEKLASHIRSIPPGRTGTFAAGIKKYENLGALGQPGYHAFSFLGYDPKSDTVKYSNPWDPGKVFSERTDDFVRKMPDTTGGFFGTATLDPLGAAISNSSGRPQQFVIN